LLSLLFEAGNARLRAVGLTLLPHLLLKAFNGLRTS